jgi:hypothetical protein
MPRSKLGVVVLCSKRQKKGQIAHPQKLALHAKPRSLERRASQLLQVVRLGHLLEELVQILFRLDGQQDQLELVLVDFLLGLQLTHRRKSLEQALQHLHLAQQILQIVILQTIMMLQME